MTAGRLWFVEVLVWILLALTFVCWLPVADRLERRRPFAFAAGFLAIGLALRYDLLGLHFGHDAWFTILAFWFFAVGWAAAKSSTVWQRLAVTLVLIVSLHGYFDNSHREVLVLAGFLLLIWLPAIRCPAWLTVVAGTVAEASLYTYLTHYQVYPLFDAHPLLGVVAAIMRRRSLTRLLNATRTVAARAQRACGYCGFGSRSAISPSCTRVAAMSAVGTDQGSGHDTAPARGGGRPGFQQVPFVRADRLVKPDRRVGRPAAVSAGLHRMPVHLQGGIDHVHVGHVCRHERVNQRVVGYRNRRPPPEPPHELAAGDASAIRMSSSSNGIDGAGPAGPVSGSVSGSPGTPSRCPCSGPGRSTAKDTVDVVNSRSPWRASTRRAAEVRPSNTGVTE